MIVKKISNPRKSSTKRVRIQSLLEYIRQPERDDTTEKCVYAGSRNFLTDTPTAQMAEMIALAEDAPRSRDPVNHYVASWRAGEHPTPAQVEQAVDILLEETVLRDHQVAYALHADTDHQHLHVVINRVHPDTLRPVQINAGFDIDAVQRAGARIEYVQGWRVEAHKRWRATGDGRAVPVDPDPNAPPERARPRPKEKRTPSQRQRDITHRTGIPSVTEQAIETLAPLIGQAQSWPDLHAVLQSHGAHFHRKGGGAAIIWRGETIKASAISRSASLRALEKHLGPYQARDPERTPPMHPRAAALLIETANDWHHLHAVLAAHGLCYERKGSGGRVHGNGYDSKASAVHRDASLRQLERRFGPYRPPEPALAFATTDVPPEPARPELPDPADAAPILKAAGSWKELHCQLARAGYGYERKGSGAIVTAGPVTVKASEVSRQATLGALQRRLGPYEPSTEPAPDRTPSPAGATDPEREAYERQREAERAERDAARLADDARHDRELAEQKARQAAERTQALAGNWTGRGKELNKRRSELAAKHRRERQRLAERRRLARKELARNYPQLPPYHAWRSTAALDVEVRPHTPIPRPVAIAGFVGVQHRHHVDYVRRDDPRQRVAFRDHGRTICVHQSRNEQTILAALRVAQARCQGRPIVVRGSERFRELSRRLADEDGIAIVEAPTRQRTPAASGVGPRPEAPTPSPASHAPPVRPPPSAVPEPTPPASSSPEPDRERETRQHPAPAPDHIHEPDRRPSVPNLLPAICPCDAGGTPHMPDVNARPPVDPPPALAGYATRRRGDGRFVEYLRTDANDRRIVIGYDAGSMITPTPAASMADLRALLQAAADRWTHVRSQRHCADSTISQIGQTGLDQYLDAVRHVAAQHDIARLVWPPPRFAAGIGKHWDDAPWRQQVHGRGGPREGGGIGAR